MSSLLCGGSGSLLGGAPAGGGGPPDPHAPTHISTGSDPIPGAVSSGPSGLMTGPDKAKLDGIDAGATVNSPDAFLLARANHTGTQTASTISDFDIEVSNSPSVTANTSKVSADGSVTTHIDVSDAGSGAIITNAERSKLGGITPGAEVNPDLVSVAEVEGGTDANERVVTAARLSLNAGLNTGPRREIADNVWNGTLHAATDEGDLDGEDFVAVRVHLPEGTYTAARVVVVSTAKGGANLTAGLYADDGGTPPRPTGAPLASSAQQAAVVDAFNDFTFTVAHTQSTTGPIWVGLIGDADVGLQASEQVVAALSAYRVAFESATGGDALPNPIGTIDVAADTTIPAVGLIRDP